jgi:ribosomal protein S18 acetylase RimI-like enzyme
MHQIETKQLTQTDLEDLVKISRQTFIETFASCNTEDNLRKYLDENVTREKLETELNNPHSVFYVATVENTVIGYLKLNHGPAQTELRDSKSLEIERIYVAKEFLGKKAGQVLYDIATLIAKRAKYDYIWLGVWEKNARAISFYKRIGFVEFDTHLFKLGEDEQTDIMMKLQLLPD